MAASIVRMAPLTLGLWIIAPVGFAQCEIAKLTDVDAQATDVFSWSVEIDGDHAFIGAIGRDDDCPMDPNCNSGSLYVYERTGTQWNEAQNLIGSDTDVRDEFGHDIGVSGNRILIGAHKKDAGAAYVFVNNGTGWVEEQKLLGSDSQDLFHFGHSVALVGDTALVGVMRDTHQGFETGAAFIFERVATGWVESIKLTASDAGMGDRYGRSSAMYGDVAVIGAHLHDDIGDDSGAAYVYERDDNMTPADPLDDSWIEQKLVASDTAMGELFGRSVAIWEDTLAVGSARSLVNGVPTGAVYVFERQLTGWVEIQKLVASDADSEDRFGISLDLEGDRMMIGARFDDEVANNAGAVYIFDRTQTGWVETAKLTASDGAMGDNLGDETGVAFSGDTAIVNGRFHDSAANNGGAAYIFAIPKEAEFTSFCQGDGGDQLGCTDCPCGNNAPQGSGGGCLNQAGQSAEVLFSGVPSLSCDSLRVEMTGGNPNTFAVLTSAAAKAPANAANPCFGLDSGISAMQINGLRCVVQNVTRHGARPMDGNGDIGFTTNGWGPPSGPAGGVLAQAGFASGVTRYFQIIYRETPFGTCTHAQQSSQGVEVSFVP